MKMIIIIKVNKGLLQMICIDNKSNNNNKNNNNNNNNNFNDNNYNNVR